MIGTRLSNQSSRPGSSLVVTWIVVAVHGDEILDVGIQWFVRSWKFVLVDSLDGRKSSTSHPLRRCVCLCHTRCDLDDGCCIERREAALADDLALDSAVCLCVVLL